MLPLIARHLAISSHLHAPCHCAPRPLHMPPHCALPRCRCHCQALVTACPTLLCPSQLHMPSCHAPWPHALHCCASCAGLPSAGAFFFFSFSFFLLISSFAVSLTLSDRCVTILSPRADLGPTSNHDDHNDGTEGRGGVSHSERACA